MTESLQSLADQVVESKWSPGVSIGVVAPGQAPIFASSGVSGPSGDAMTSDTACNWFSMTKIATATTAVLLADRGELDLDAPVAQYLGVEWPKIFADVTTRNLLSHSGGLANPIPIRWVHESGRPFPAQRDFLSRIVSRQRRARGRPGTRARYSNVGYLAVGEVIASAVSDSFEAVVKKELLSPLGMDSTGWSWQELGSTPRAVGHHPCPPGAGAVLKRIMPEGTIGNRHGRMVDLRAFEVDGLAYGGLIGTIRDAAKLLELHVNGGEQNGRRLLSTSAIEEMAAVTTPGTKRSLGLGWFHSKEDKEEAVEHLGGGMGFWNVMRLRSDHPRGAVVMSNTSRHWPISNLADSAITSAGLGR